LKLSRPPVLATWLFEHLTRRGHHEALAGDLLEEYSRRRSDTWYWRQVLAAIAADFSTELRSHWVSVVFALVVCGTIPSKQLSLNARFQSFLFSGIQLSWPVSFLVGIAIISAFQSAILLAALSVYVVGTKSFHLRSFLIALYPALLVLALGNTAVTISQVLPWPRLFFYYVIWRLPLFFSLVLSMRVVRANAGRAGASRLTT
jgi:hypothetical protein